MKKSMSLMLVIAMIATIFSMCGITSFAEDDILSYLTYEINDGEVTITDCDESISGDVVIPDTVSLESTETGLSPGRRLVGQFR